MENAVASIYSIFMKSFPEEKDFWEDLVNDETGHSSFLIDAGYQGIFDGLQLNDLPLTMPLVEKTLKFADNISNHIKFNPVSLEDACKLALKLEETMVETFTNDLMAHLVNPNNKSFIERILKDEKTHIDKIRDMMIKKGFLKLS